jgi:hypothetical protein
VGNSVPIGKETLTLARYNELADVPPEREWLANITNPKTRRFYKSDVEEFRASPDCVRPRSCARLRARMS